MLGNKKRTVLIIILAVTSFLLAMGSWIYLEYSSRTQQPIPTWLHQWRFYRWNWLPVLCLSGYGLTLTRSWKPVSKLFKVAVLIVLLMAVALGLLSLLLLAFACIALSP
jgi:hypothetical protein